jgi:HD-GYP domain-containing protein (c-di-GMP phosphodiesterase class II)
MMVADVFNALTEDRPYRKGLSVYEALNHIRDLVSNNKLDRDVFNKLKNNLADILEMLIGIRKNALENFAKFYSDIEGSESYAINME